MNLFSNHKKGHSGENFTTFGCGKRFKEKKVKKVPFYLKLSDWGVKSNYQKKDVLSKMSKTPNTSIYYDWYIYFYVFHNSITSPSMMAFFPLNDYFIFGSSLSTSLSLSISSSNVPTSFATWISVGIGFGFSNTKSCSTSLVKGSQQVSTFDPNKERMFWISPLS